MAKQIAVVIGPDTFHLMSLTIPDYCQPQYKDIFRVQTAFANGLDREVVNDGRADFIPVFLSEVPLLFRRDIFKPRISMLQVTPADEHGYHSMGTTVACMREAIIHSEMVIGEVNPRLPRTFGHSIVHESHFDFLVENKFELEEIKPKPMSEVEKAIGKHKADNLIEDGATLQMGIGGIPDAVLAQCKSHKDLGFPLAPLLQPFHQYQHQKPPLPQ